MDLVHTAVWGKSLVDELTTRGFSLAQIVGNTGIRLSSFEGEKPRISFVELAKLFERAAEITGDDLVGFRHGQNREYRRGGIVTYVGLSSPTVRTLLHNLARYQRVTSDAIQIETSRLDDEGILEWRFQVPQGVMRRQYIEFGSAGIIDILRRLTDRIIRPVSVELRHVRSKNTEVIQKFFGCPTKFGANRNRIQLRLKDLELPLKTADDYLLRILVEVCESTLQEQAHKKDKGALVVDIERLVADDPMISQAHVAKELGMSPRTLSRKLHELGTSFLSIVEGYKEAMAKSLIEDTDLQLTEIAFVLGYADQSSFSAAFKRWTGSTPSSYRH